MKDKNKIELDIEVNKDELEETADTFERIGNAMPNIVVRNNENVYFTVNNFIEKKKDTEYEEEK